MSNALIVLTRQDLNANGIQILDLTPNSSQHIQWRDGSGQSGYISAFTPGTMFSSYVTTATTDHMTVDTTGLAAYLIDNVEDADNGDIILTASRANAIVHSLCVALVAKTPLTLAAVNTMIQTATGGGSSTLSSGNSTGSLTALLSILQGVVYKVAAGAVVSGSGHAFVTGPHTPVGSFVGPTDPTFVNTRTFVLTGALQLSAAGGNLAGFASSTFQFTNPLLSYTAGNGNNIDGSDIATTGVGSAISVYDHLGNLIA